METIGLQTQELIEKRPGYVVLLNSNIDIVYSNKSWIDYCSNHQLPTSLWKIGEYYLKDIVLNNNLETSKQRENIFAGNGQAHFQLVSNAHINQLENFFIKFSIFPLDGGETGTILYIQPSERMSVESLNPQLILENMTDAFYLLDEKMNFYYVNSKTESLLNINKEEVLGYNIWTVFPSLIGTGFYTNYNRAIQERISLHFEEYYASLDSWYSVKVIPDSKGGLAVYYQKIEQNSSKDNANSSCSGTDYLTGLLTRRNFEENVKTIVQKEIPFSLLYINLDNFKHINTLYNHEIGDKIIKVIGRELENTLHPTEIAARLDGDELILLHFTQEGEHIEEFPHKVKEVFESPFILENSKMISVSASIGMSFFPHDSTNVEELIAFAECAMREAKKQSGPSFSIFQPHLAIDLARRLMIEKDLSGDLKAKGFHFALQPQINCSNEGLSGVEVLARWKHPVLGPISPLEFIAIAEETGTISYLTNHLLKEVFTFMRKHNSLGNKVPKTAINITPSLLTNKKFFEDLFRLMDSYQISSEWIEIEITESVELTVSELTLQNLAICRSKGITIALDDFGTGFSMLAYLMDFPIDKIKLDKSFISKIGYNKKSEEILKSLILFINSIGFELVAEGVETNNEADFLKYSGCLIHQGYYYDKPLLPERFEKRYLESAESKNKKVI